jgi:hypothetical protein
VSVVKVLLDPIVGPEYLDASAFQAESSTMKVGPIPAWLVVAGGAVVVGVAGFVLVLSAPFDDSARTGLGSGLITGMIVGLALAAIQWTVERYEEANKEVRHATMHQVAVSRIAALVSAHIWNLWNLLLPYVDSKPPLVTVDPQGYSPDDLRNTQRALQWLRERMGADPPWWRDATLRATADVLSFVSTDLVERTGFPEQTMVGPRALDEVRREVAWLLDQLRPDTVIVNEYGEPTSPGTPHPAVYRWGPLLAGEDPSSAWNQRFCAGSWLRRIFDTSAEELPAWFGIKSPAQPTSDA